MRLNRQQMNIRGGCQCKVGGVALADLLEDVSRRVPGALSRSDQGEDSAYFETGTNRLLLTTDLLPVIGVDMVDAGFITALHCMSDIYASGGVPRWAAINLVVDPEFPVVIAEELMVGLFSACLQEGVAVLAGHSLYGPEAMVGLCVVGSLRASSPLRKTGTHDENILLISKPVGVGLVLRAYKLGLVGEQELAEAVSLMRRSNRFASSAAVDACVTAATDVTGFGVLGHLSELLAPAGLGATIHINQVPILSAAKALPSSVGRTRWLENNYDYAASRCRLVGVTDFERVFALLDPQTNGGLLVAADVAAASRLVTDGFVPIGRVNSREAIELID